ncbi:hypothetical protein PENTCL1PPCAC_18594, partial [Pristionchus entomophagus]
MEVRSREVNSEFVRAVRTKISEQKRRGSEAKAVFWLEPTVPDGWMTLDRYLERFGPFPVHCHFTASITQQIATAILFLHQSKMVYGSLTAESIVIDLDGAVHILPPSSNQRHSMQDDIRSIGKLLLRLVTGQKDYPPPHTLFPVNRSMIKLVGLMLDTPMTAGQVRYHPTLSDSMSEKPTTFFFNQ